MSAQRRLPGGRTECTLQVPVGAPMLEAGRPGRPHVRGRAALAVPGRPGSEPIAVKGQLPDERVDLAQRQGRAHPAVEVALQEAVDGHAEFERGVGGLFGDGGTLLLAQGEDAEDATDAGVAVVAVDLVTNGGEGGAGALGGGEQGEDLCRGPGGPVPVLYAMPAPRHAQVFAEELAGVRVEQADVGAVPLHVDAAADPAGRRAVVGRRDLDAAVEMHAAVTVLVVAKRLERQRAERRAFLSKHGGDLALGRAVDPRGARLGRSPDPEASSPVPVPAADAGEESVDTSDEMAGFAGRAGGRPRPRTVRPAAFR